MNRRNEEVVNANRTMICPRIQFHGPFGYRAIFGEFEFILYGSLKSQISQLKQLGPSYGRTAMEMMMLHYAFFSQLNKVEGIDTEEYVTREAVICCSYGTKNILLDTYEDHGVIAANGRPLMTCEDCRENENIYSFGLCNCQEHGVEYNHSLPHPKTIGAPDESGRMRYFCFPVLGKRWMQAEGDVFISKLEGDEFVEALRTARI